MNSKDKYFVLVLMMWMGLMMAQKVPLSDQEAFKVQQLITNKAKNINTLEADFKQVKHLDILQNDIMAEGKMHVKSPDRIKWAYFKPFTYTAVFKKNKLYINDNGNKSSFNLGSSPSFSSLNDLIMKSVRGDMFDEALFNFKFYKTQTVYLVSFIPKQKALLEIIPELQIAFDLNEYTVTQVTMKESDKDYTLLVFKNQKYNITVPDEVFNP